MKHLSHAVEDTVRLGSEFARKLGPGSVVALFGDLGSGKTHFIKGVSKGLGVNEHVGSPTFTIVNEYAAGNLTVCHFDFYRLKSLSELREIGFDEYINGDSVSLIEWADRVKNLLPPHRFDVFLKLGQDENSREIKIEEVNP